MGDLKTPWEAKDQAFTGTDLSGAGITSRGSDPNSDGGDGEAGLQQAWKNPPFERTETAESSNSVSGLPSLPNRYEPTETPPDPPNLQDRSPGTIDKR